MNVTPEDIHMWPETGYNLAPCWYVVFNDFRVEPAKFFSSLFLCEKVIYQSKSSSVDVQQHEVVG